MIQPSTSQSISPQSSLPGPVQLIAPRRYGDARGWFAEVYSEQAFAARGIDVRFVQDNHSMSTQIGVLRGLHFQLPPFAQDKLVRCIRGRIFDVAVDIRLGSPTFGQWVGAELTADNGHQLFVPVGFAHGFMTLEPDTEVCYKVSAPYAPAHDAGLIWNDPDIAIDWPLSAGVSPVLSPKDEAHASLSAFSCPFAYDGRPLQPIRS